MRLFTSRGLAYPITVTKLIRQPGDEIEANAPLFTYKYTALNTEYDEDKRENVEKERTYYSDFESEVEGTVSSLDVKVGQVIERYTSVAEIEEPCRHEVQFGGLCANCGQDMTLQQYSTTTSNTERAKINNVHGHTSLLVSESEALRADGEAKRRLLDARKLSLVVDLDQTIIQACVEPTVAEWQKDPSNPNYEAVKNVRAFQLVDDGPGARGTWYYIKLRPGVEEFLETMAQYYELHIYTMATRAYAENIAKIVDPDQKLFGDRILSRDENGSMNSKSLARLFPVDTKMVVIIDDRGDVWSWSPNLVKVPAYDFFVGVGDINSVFLPKRNAELEARPPNPPAEDKSESVAPDAKEDAPSSATPSSTAALAATTGDVSTLMMSMAGDQDEGKLKEQADEQEVKIAEQLTERPLLKKQKMLEQAEEEARTSPAVEAATAILSENGEGKDGGEGEAAQSKYRHNLLQDDDNELEAVGATLRRIHNLYYDEYDKDNVGFKGGRVSELRPGHRKKRSLDELQNIPDATDIMEGIRSQILAGVHLVFTGVVRLGLDIHSQDIAHWAKWFGATVSENINKRTTHVIASPDRRTAKVRQAAKKGDRISIVNQNWLYACFTQWERVAEGPYRIHSDARTNGAGGLPDSFEGKEFALSSSDEEAAHTEEEDAEESGTSTPNGFGKTQLVIDTDVEELEKFGPSAERKDSSPTETENADDWDAVNKELEDELGSDWDDDSDAESIRSENSVGNRTPKSERKRKRDALENGDDAGGDGDSDEGSRLQKRKREALARTTSLTNVASLASANGTPKREPPVAEDEDGSDLEADLEAALAAEMEKELAEELGAE